MDTHVNKVAEPATFGTSRAHANLNKIALAFNKLGAVNVESCTTLGTVAGIVDMDRGHVGRLISDRPGFVKVTRLMGGDRSVGYYYMADKFIPVAVSQGVAGYPTNTYALFDSALPTSITVSDGSVRLGADKPRVDIRFDSEVGYWPATTIEASKTSADRLQKVFTVEYGQTLVKVIDEYRYKPNSSIEPLERAISTLVSLRNWLLVNGSDPEAANMLGAFDA